MYIRRAFCCVVSSSLLLSHATSCYLTLYNSLSCQYYESRSCSISVPSVHGDRSLSGRLFSFLSAALVPDLSSVLRPLFSVLCPRHRPRVPPGRRSPLRCSAVHCPLSGICPSDVCQSPSPSVSSSLPSSPSLPLSPSLPSSPSLSSLRPRPRPRPTPLSAAFARPAFGPLLRPRHSRVSVRPVFLSAAFARPAFGPLPCPRHSASQRLAAPARHSSRRRVLVPARHSLLKFARSPVSLTVFTRREGERERNE